MKLKLKKIFVKICLPEDDIVDDEVDDEDDDGTGPFDDESRLWVGPFVWIVECS